MARFEGSAIYKAWINAGLLLLLLKILEQAPLKLHTYLIYWKSYQAVDTSILRVYKQMKPLSAALVFYGLHKALLITNLNGKSITVAIQLIMRKFKSTYPNSIWQPPQEYSVGKNDAAACNHSLPGADGWLHIGTLSH